MSSTLMCFNKNPAIRTCANPSCKSIALICNNNQCTCNSFHKYCDTTIIQNLKGRLQDKQRQIKQYCSFLIQFIDVQIQQFNKIKQQTLNLIANKSVLNNHESHVLKSIIQGQSYGITSQQTAQSVLSLDEWKIPNNKYYQNQITFSQKVIFQKIHYLFQTVLDRNHSNHRQLFQHIEKPKQSNLIQKPSKKPSLFDDQDEQLQIISLNQKPKPKNKTLLFSDEDQQ